MTTTPGVPPVIGKFLLTGGTVSVQKPAGTGGSSSIHTSTYTGRTIPAPEPAQPPVNRVLAEGTGTRTVTILIGPETRVNIADPTHGGTRMSAVEEGARAVSLESADLMVENEETHIYVGEDPTDFFGQDTAIESSANLVHDLGNVKGNDLTTFVNGDALASWLMAFPSSINRKEIGGVDWSMSVSENEATFSVRDERAQDRIVEKLLDEMRGRRNRVKEIEMNVLEVTTATGESFKIKVEVNPSLLDSTETESAVDSEVDEVTAVFESNNERTIVDHFPAEDGSQDERTAAALRATAREMKESLMIQRIVSKALKNDKSFAHLSLEDRMVISKKLRSSLHDKLYREIEEHKRNPDEILDQQDLIWVTLTRYAKDVLWEEMKVIAVLPTPSSEKREV
jgi:hypothetical protein